MRVTNSMLVNNYMNNLNTNMSSISKLQNQLSSGKKFAHISDDPVALIYSQQARYKLSVLSDYQNNVSTAKGWLTQTEIGTTELNSIIASVYERTIDAATDVKNGTDLTNIANYIREMRDQVLQTLNQTLGEKYVYGGYNTTGYTNGGINTPPFSVNADGNLCFNGYDLTDPLNDGIIEQMRQDVLTFDVSVGTNMAATANGINVAFYGKDEDGNNLNVYNLLNDLYNTIIDEDTSADDVNLFITDLQKAQNHMLAISAEIGGRVNRIEILESRYEQDTLNYTQMLSDAEDVDLAEVAMKFKMAESVYNASLSVGGYIIQPTLMDFLR